MSPSGCWRPTETLTTRRWLGFVAGIEDAIAEVFGQVLGLRVAGGLVDAGVVAIDGTKIAANASAWANRTRKQLAEEILAEADRVDATEDAELGERRGDELPARWSDRRDRRSRVRAALGSSEAAGGADFESLMAERAVRDDLGAAHYRVANPADRAHRASASTRTRRPGLADAATGAALRAGLQRPGAPSPVSRSSSPRRCPTPPTTPPSWPRSWQRPRPTSATPGTPGGRDGAGRRRATGAPTTPPSTRPHRS